MNDPWATIGGIYQALGRELRPETEQRMRDFLAAHPSDWWARSLHLVRHQPER